jgi:hypothetical protein
VFLNRVLRIFAHKKKEVTECCRKLHNYEFHNLCFSQNIIRLIKARRMRWVGHIARIEEKQNAFKVLIGKKPLGRHRHR